MAGNTLLMSFMTSPLTNPAVLSPSKYSIFAAVSPSNACRSYANAEACCFALGTALLGFGLLFGNSRCCTGIGPAVFAL